MRLLLDSSVYIRWIRQRQNPATILRPRLRTGELLSCGVVRAEVLRGVVPPKLRLELTQLFGSLTEVPTDRRVWDLATTLAWTLDRRGRVLPLTDILIAACALSVRATIVTPDAHFQAVPGLTVYPSLP